MSGIFSPILVVDDSPTMRSVVRSMLTALGWQNIHEAGSGISALALLKARRFELVICDWNMEPMNGLELLRSIRGTRPSLTFVMMTAHAVKFSSIARDHGCINYLAKPFTKEQLAAKVRTAMVAVTA